MNETNENESNGSAIIQKIGEDLVVLIPNDICEKLDIKEGSEVSMTPFLCSGEVGIRTKPKT